MSKNLFYKAITWEKRGYSNHRLDNPIISHNIPEDHIINDTDIKYWSKDFGSSWFSRKCIYLKDDVFETVKNKIIWPTEDCHNSVSGEYMGALIIRTEDKRDIITFIKMKESQNGERNYVLIPIDYLATPEQRAKNSWDSNYTITNKLPKRNVKVFLTFDEYQTDKENKKNKASQKRTSTNKKIDDLKESVPCFNLTSPKFKIIEVIKETDWVKAGVGDVIHGELPVIGMYHDNPTGLLKGIGTRTNYIDVYVNGEMHRSMSPLTFQDLFMYNFKVIQVK